MAYTVKKVAAMSGVSTRTLRFYDEVGLLKPDDWQKSGAVFEEICRDLTFALERKLGVDSLEVQNVIRRHYQWLKLSGRQTVSRTRDTAS